MNNELNVQVSDTTGASQHYKSREKINDHNPRHGHDYAPGKSGSYKNVQ